jgi:hypothetical protein
MRSLFFIGLFALAVSAYVLPCVNIPPSLEIGTAPQRFEAGTVYIGVEFLGTPANTSTASAVLTVQWTQNTTDALPQAFLNIGSDPNDPIVIGNNCAAPLSSTTVLAAPLQWVVKRGLHQLVVLSFGSSVPVLISNIQVQVNVLGSFQGQGSCTQEGIASFNNPRCTPEHARTQLQ